MVLHAVHVEKKKKHTFFENRKPAHRQEHIGVQQVSFTREMSPFYKSEQSNNNETSYHRLKIVLAIQITTALYEVTTWI